MKRKLVATLLGLFVVFSAFAANLNHVMMTSIKSGNIPVSEGFSSLFDGFWLFAILAAILCIGIAVGLYVLVAVMAQQRHRSVVAWILLSMIASPLLMIIILLCIGDSQKDSIDGDACPHDHCS